MNRVSIMVEQSDDDDEIEYKIHSMVSYSLSSISSCAET